MGVIVIGTTKSKWNYAAVADICKFSLLIPSSIFHENSSFHKTVKNSEVLGQMPSNPCNILKLKSFGRKFASFVCVSLNTLITVCYDKNNKNVQ